MSVSITCARCHNSWSMCTCPPIHSTNAAIPSPLQQPAQPFTFVPQLTEEQVRKIVSEEVRKALQEETDEEDASPPRVIRLAKKATMYVKFEHDGVLYAGEVYPVEVQP